MDEEWDKGGGRFRFEADDGAREGSTGGPEGRGGGGGARCKWHQRFSIEIVDAYRC